MRGEIEREKERERGDKRVEEVNRQTGREIKRAGEGFRDRQSKRREGLLREGGGLLGEVGGEGLGKE